MVITPKVNYLNCLFRKFLEKNFVYGQKSKILSEFFTQSLGHFEAHFFLNAECNKLKT